jgi:peptidylprolyl isomerase
VLRRLPLVLIPALLTLGLTACGDDGPANNDGRERLDAVSISGDVGTEPTVEWKGRMSAGKIESETVVEGDGAELEDGDSVLAQLWIGNGFTQEKAFSTYEEKRAELITVDDQLAPFLAAVRGATIGSRIAVTSSAEDAFGEAGNAQLGIGNKDSVLVIIDLVSGIEDGPSGDRHSAPGWMPPIKFAKGKPAGFTFEGAPAPTDQLRKAVLLKGKGAKIEKGQTIAVRYVGQTFGGKKPFDQNFDAPGPTSFGIGTGQVIKAWDQALVGATIGTRMVIEVPPALGYGEQGNEQAGIKGTDTLVFLIDVLGAA